MGKLTLYTRDGCPNSHAAKLDLKLLKLPYREIELSDEDNELSPILYFDDIRIDGGLNELVDKLLNENLDVEPCDDDDNHDDPPALSHMDESCLSSRGRSRAASSMTDDSSYREDWERYAKRQYQKNNNTSFNFESEIYVLKEEVMQEVQSQLEIFKDEIYGTIQEDYQREMQTLKGTIAGLKGTLATLKASMTQTKAQLTQTKQIAEAAAEDQQQVVDRLQERIRLVEQQQLQQQSQGSLRPSSPLDERRSSNHSHSNSTNSYHQRDSFDQRSSAHSTNYREESPPARPSINKREMFQRKMSYDRHSFHGKTLRNNLFRDSDRAQEQSRNPMPPSSSSGNRREMFQKKVSYDRHSFHGNTIRENVQRFLDGEEDYRLSPKNSPKATRPTRKSMHVSSAQQNGNSNGFDRREFSPKRNETISRAASDHSLNSPNNNSNHSSIGGGRGSNHSVVSAGRRASMSNRESSTQNPIHNNSGNRPNRREMFQKKTSYDRHSYHGKALRDAMQREKATSPIRSSSLSRREVFQRKSSYDKNSFRPNQLRDQILNNSKERDNQDSGGSFANEDMDDDQNSFGCAEDDEDTETGGSRFLPDKLSPKPQERKKTPQDLQSLVQSKSQNIRSTRNLNSQQSMKSTRNLTSQQSMKSIKSAPSMRGGFGGGGQLSPPQMRNDDFNSLSGKRSIRMTRSSASASVRSFNSSTSASSTFHSGGTAVLFADNMVELPLGNLMSNLEATAELKRILPVVDMKYNRTTYRNSFKGTSVADSFVEAFGITRKEAVDLGKSLVKARMIHHVCDDHGYKDVGWFYRLHCHQTPAVLNSYVFWTDEVTLSKHCSEVIEELMERLQALMDTITCTDSGLVDYARASMVVSEEEMLELDFAMCELQLVKLARLDQRDLQAVGLNVFQIFVHYAFLKLGVPPSSSTSAQTAFWTDLKLNVGGDLFSLHEWFNGICRGNRKGQHGAKPFQGKDPRCFLKLPKNVDLRVHFAAGMTHFIKPMFVYDGNNMDKQLDGVGKQYFERPEYVHLDSSSLTLSPMFQSYLVDFGTTTKGLPAALMQWFPSAQRSQLDKIMASKKKIKVEFTGACDAWDEYAGQHVQFKSAPKADFKTVLSLTSAGVDLGVKSALARVTRRLGDGVAQPVSQVKNNMEAAIESLQSASSETTGPRLDAVVPL